jgi:hypothetical protein
VETAAAASAAAVAAVAIDPGETPLAAVASSGHPHPPALSTAPSPVTTKPGAGAAAALDDGGETAPVAEGDRCAVLRSGALRSEASLNSPPMGRLVPAGSAVVILEVARVWRFPLPGEPVWRARVGLVEAEDGGESEGEVESLGWMSLKTAGGKDILRSSDGPSKLQQTPTTAATTTATTLAVAAPGSPSPSRGSSAAASPSSPSPSSSPRTIPVSPAQQKIAARLARIDKLAEQKEAEYEWTEVKHQSGKSYWCVHPLRLLFLYLPAPSVPAGYLPGYCLLCTVLWVARHWLLIVSITCFLGCVFRV